MRQCPYQNSEVPCHRVIKADGSVGGYGGEGVPKKASLLRKEGIVIRDGRINLPAYFFNRFAAPKFS
jgi:alkylated DNA nucleotide flippase Atl1